MSRASVDADAFNAFEAAGWEHQVSGYEDFFGPITTRLVGPLLDAAEVDRGARVLDVASGPGYVAAAAAERGAFVIGVDIAEGMLSLARRRHPQLDFRFGDAEALPFDYGSFDAVVANFALVHVGRPERAAAEFARVLDADGRVALTVWDFPDQARLHGVLLDAVAKAGAGSPQDIPAGPPLFRFSDEQEFARLLREQGLEDLDVSTVSFAHAQPSADALWRGLLDGTVRLSAMIVGQTHDTQRRIRAAFDELVQPYQVGTGLAIPVSVKLASARKPG